MAQRRMFSKEVTNSSEFQMMSPSAQALYFHIGMNADDDGFCEAFTIVRMTESKPDDLRALQERSFIYLVDSKVCIVKDWHTNNDIRVDRYSRSKYLSDPHYSEVYGVIMEDKIKHLSRYKEMLGITDGTTTGSPQVRLGKVSLDTNADSLRSSDSLERVDVPDEDSVVRVKADPNVDKVCKYWNKKCLDEFNLVPSGGIAKHRKVVKDAHKHLTYPQIKEMIDEWFDNGTLEPHEMIQITRCLSAFQIDKFNAENV